MRICLLVKIITIYMHTHKKKTPKENDIANTNKLLQRLNSIYSLYSLHAYNHGLQ